MIDKSKISKYTVLDTSKFDKRMYHQKSEKVNQETGEIYWVDCFKYKINNNISVIYSNLKNTITLEGRFININYIKNRVYNFDDYLVPHFKELTSEEVRIHSDEYLMDNSYYDEDDNLQFDEREQTINHTEVIESLSIDEMISDINEQVNQLLNPEIELDIRDFNIVSLEVCFNIWLDNDYVNEYIKLFNHIFKTKNHKIYKNYVFEEGVPKYTSFYVKTSSAYEENINGNYTVNFYNKLDQLKSIQDDYKVTEEDLALAKKCLRLEVKLFYGGLNQVCCKRNIDKTFGSFLNLDVCLYVLKHYYNRFIADPKLDFYNYSRAKAKIEETKVLSAKDRKNLLNYIKEKYQYNKKHSDATRRKYGEMLGRIRIAETFIPTSYGVDFMQSPIKLLSKKHEQYQKYNDELAEHEEDMEFINNDE